jgi:phosphatidylethanolamine/phosphatidyl-N-methylethanolamine N-methyltransferase
MLTRYDAMPPLTAYDRMAGAYDYLFGPLLGRARLAAVAAVNALPGEQVLEVGVGTGLALPHYHAAKRITGIDLSEDMLCRARRLARGFSNIDGLFEMDAQATAFANQRFDIAVVMFVVSVVESPRLLLAELRRVVKPGGWIVILNHFAAEDGALGWAERAVTPVCQKLGWRADVRLGDIFEAAELRDVRIDTLPPFGLFRLLQVKT